MRARPVWSLWLASRLRRSMLWYHSLQSGVEGYGKIDPKAPSQRFWRKVVLCPELWSAHSGPRDDACAAMHALAVQGFREELMTKLIIQIPCYNEEETLGVTLDDLPRRVPGIQRVEWLVIDDGSADRTAEVARRHGVHHVVRLPVNQGLARAFMAGIRHSLAAGADIIVNTDADNQYCAADIPKLIQPILEGRASIVIGARAIAQIDHFSRRKKLLQRLGSWVVRVASGTDVPDAPSGFRAFSREAALLLNVFNTHTYTLETIIQAGRRGIPIVSVPIRTNPDLRPSRLIRSLPSYVLRSAVTILRSFATYKPLRFFASIGIAALCGRTRAWPALPLPGIDWRGGWPCPVGDSECTAHGHGCIHGTDRHRRRSDRR